MKELCLLAMSYNEDEHIKFWIDNHKDFVDEIILVDTGSTDKTVEIAKENGVKVFNYKWEHDFSKAKNFALKICDTECHPDWILFMSPDFWVSNPDMRTIREAIETDDFDVYRTKLMYHHNDWFDFENTTIHGAAETGIGQIVLYKNYPHIYYSSPVHETIEASLKADTRIGYIEVTRHHDDANIDKVSREIYFSALLETKYDVSELNSMREKLYRK